MKSPNAGSVLFADYWPDVPGVKLPVTVREMVFDDVSACADLAAQRESGDTKVWRDAFVKSLSRDDRMTFVAVRDDEIVGYASVTKLTLSSDPQSYGAPDGWYLAGTLVAPAWRRHGFGTALTQACLDWLGRRCDKVWYFVNATNQASRDMHAKLGFRDVTSDFSIPKVTFAGGRGVLGVLDIAAQA